MRFCKTFLILFISILTINIKASHLMGGEITWSCGPNHGYIFKMVLYRDCTGIDIISSSLSINSNSPLGTIRVDKQTSDILSDRCGVNCTNTQSLCRAGPVEKITYASSEQFFPVGQFPPTGGWEFSWSSCCRPGAKTCSATSSLYGGNVNIVPANDSYYLRAKMYSYTLASSTVPLSLDSCYDSSPSFQEDANLIICEGGDFAFNHLASDSDIDSLIFDWAHPLEAANSPVTWAPGYSHRVPFPDQTEDSRNGPVTLDTKTGVITMKIINSGTPITKAYVSCISIQSYRCGQLIGEIFRDVSIFIMKNCGTNEKPSAEIDTALYSNIQRNGDVYTITAYPEDTIVFKLSAQDLDILPPSFGQYVTFEAEGLQMSRPNYGSGIGCHGLPPCATATPVFPQINYRSFISNDILFEWSPQCEHLSFVKCNSTTSRYYFTLKMSDDHCPASDVALATLIINVLRGDLLPPTLKCINYSSNGDVEISWVQPPLHEKLARSSYYVIWGSDSAVGPFTSLDTIFDYNVTSTVISGQNPPRHYYLQLGTGCDFLSDPSDTMSIMQISLNPRPPGSAQYVDLSWNAPTANLPSTSTGIYEIWRELPLGSSNWTKIKETSSLSYTDTSQICNGYVAYQIRLTDTSSAMCYSSSTLDSAFLSDQINTDVIAIDSVAVNARGIAILSWQPSTYGDVIKYYLLYNDPKTGWKIVDTIPVGTLMPYEWTASEADTRSEEFKIISIDSCGNQSDELVAQSYNTIYLRSRLNKCEEYSRVSWNSYNRFPKGAGGYYLWVQITDNNGNTSSKMLLHATSADDTTYVHRKLLKDYQYCYIVQAYNITGLITSSSNETCIKATIPQKSRLLYLAQVTNDPNQGALNRGVLILKVYIDKDADVLSFTIERSLDYYGHYEIVGEVVKPTTAPYVIDYLDFSVNADRYHYYYRVSSNNICKKIDTISNTARNILLSVNSNANLTNTLTWNPYETWGGEVARYDIYRSGDNSTFNLVKSNIGTDTSYIDDISAFKDLQSVFCYYIVAEEDNNPSGLVDDDGMPFTSVSNVTCVNQKARIFIPNAFRPSSTVLQNQTFGPNLEFEDPGNYMFYILDRWGNLMFKTKDPSQKWDGIYEGQPARQGVYVYYIKYATPGNHPLEKRGSFTLVR